MSNFQKYISNQSTDELHPNVFYMVIVDLFKLIMYYTKGHNLKQKKLDPLFST